MRGSSRVTRSLAVLVAGLLAGTLAGCGGGSATKPVQVGTVLGGRAKVLDGRKVAVKLPIGTVDFQVTGPTRTLGKGQTDEFKELSGGDDVRFVGVSWTYDRFDYPDATQLTLQRRVHDVRVWLVADDHRYQIDGLEYLRTGIGDGAWIAVPARTERLRLAVEYDGLTQLLDPVTGRLDTDDAESQRAAPLYQDLPVAAEQKCPKVVKQQQGVDYNYGCTVHSAVVTPYADGVGWAPDGQEWVAVDLALYFQEPPYWRLDVQYDVTPTRRAFNLNGADVKATLFQHWDGTNDAALLVFPTPTPAQGQGQSDEYRLGGSLRYVGRVEKQLGDGRGFPTKPVFDVDLDFPVRFSAATS